MPDYVKYRFCPNVTCDNHINKKKFKAGAEVCGECGFALKDYDFDPVTRQIIGYDEEDAPDYSVNTSEENSSVPNFENDFMINFQEEKEEPLFEASNTPAVEPIKEDLPASTPISNAPISNNEDAEKIALKKQLDEMAKQMAQMQALIARQFNQPQTSVPAPAPTIKETETLSSAPIPSVHDNQPTIAVKNTENINMAIIPKQKDAPNAESKEVLSEPIKEEHTVHIPIMTKEEEEKKRKEVQEEVAKEFELKRIKEERERQRVEFEKAYNESKKAEQRLIQEERERQEAKYNKDNGKEEETKIDYNQDGFYNSNEPLVEDIYKKSKKKTIIQIATLTVVIIAILYGVLYFTS